MPCGSCHTFFHTSFGYIFPYSDDDVRSVCVCVCVYMYVSIAAPFSCINMLSSLPVVSFAPNPRPPSYYALPFIDSWLVAPSAIPHSISRFALFRPWLNTHSTHAAAFFYSMYVILIVIVIVVMVYCPIFVHFWLDSDVQAFPALVALPRWRHLQSTAYASLCRAPFCSYPPISAREEEAEKVNAYPYHLYFMHCLPWPDWSWLYRQADLAIAVSHSWASELRRVSGYV